MTPGSNEFITHILELLAPIPEVTARRMFGGWGFFRNGRMFGLVADDVLYLKADAGNQPKFEARELGPFLYEGARGTMRMSYYRAPEEALDESAVMVEWARDALAAAERAVQARPRKKPGAAGKTPRQKARREAGAGKLQRKTAGKKTATHLQMPAKPKRSAKAPRKKADRKPGTRRRP